MSENARALLDDSEEPQSELDEDDLRVRPLRIRKNWEPEIPDDLMKSLTARERHVLVTLSLMAQKIDWLMDASLVNNSDQRMMDRRLVRVERWKRVVASKWSILAAGLGILATVAVDKFIEKWIK